MLLINFDLIVNVFCWFYLTDCCWHKHSRWQVQWLQHVCSAKWQKADEKESWTSHSEKVVVEKEEETTGTDCAEETKEIKGNNFIQKYLC